MMILPPGFRYIDGRLHARAATDGEWRIANRHERNRVREMREAHEAGDMVAFRAAHGKLVAKLNYKLDTAN